jgi:hypothetical protein
MADSFHMQPGECMIKFDAAHEAVHHPPDRRFRIWIRPSFIMVTICLGLIPLVLAWGQAAIFGLPYLAPLTKFNPAPFTRVHGFPGWLRWAHFFNFVFLMMLVRSGLSILWTIHAYISTTTARPALNGFVSRHCMSLPIACGLRKTMRVTFLRSSVCRAIGIRWEWHAPGISSTCMGSSSRV